MDKDEITTVEEDHNEKEPYEPYDTFENIKTILMFVLLGVAIAMLINDFLSRSSFKDLDSRITALETKVNDLIITESEDHLDLCPLCGSEVKLYTNEYDGFTSYKIECPNCKLETKNYYEKGDLIEYWNGQIYNNINKKEEHE